MNALHASPIERVRAAVTDYLATPDSYPLVVPVKDEHVQDQLDRQHALRERRKFTNESTTGYGELT